MARWIQQLIVLAVLLLGLWAARAWLDRGARLAEDRAEGRAHVIDGDSLRIGGEEIRLLGVDAPEGRQTCRRSGATWACGEQARDALARMIGGQQVACRGHERDRFNRMLAVCEAGGRELNGAMVAEGWVVAYGKRYADEEGQAKAARRGLWSGEFERPHEWRRQNGVGR